MNKDTKTFVGMLVMTKIKTSDDSHEEIVALLQRRGKINTENIYGFKWQSFPGLCEITSYGKAEFNESPDEAIKRELTEELGKEAAKTVFKSKPVKIYEETETDGDHIYVWAVLCDKKILKEISLDISTGGIEILRKEDLNKIDYVNFDQKGAKVKDLNEVKLFEVPVKVLEKSFERFSNLTK